MNDYYFSSHSEQGRDRNYTIMEQPSPAPGPGPGPAPTDASQWRESVMSTRSLSYMSSVGLDVGQTNPNLKGGALRLQEQIAERQKERRARKEKSSSPYNLKAAGNASELPTSVASSPLFSLPTELRQLIWSYALSPSSGTPEVTWPYTVSTHLQPQLLRTCRPIYEEAARILYTTTNLSFAHPSDANMFRRALASHEYAPLLPHFTISLRAADAKLWTAYFNSTSPERSLVRDFPHLRSVTLCYYGLRYAEHYNHAQNVRLWLKDPRLQEVILSARKCSWGRGADPLVVRVVLCVILPDEVRRSLQGERVMSVGWDSETVTLFGEAWLLGCYIKVEDLSRVDLPRV